MIWKIGILIINDSEIIIILLTNNVVNRSIGDNHVNINNFLKNSQYICDMVLNI